MRQRVLHICLIVTAGVLTYLTASMAGFLSIDDVGMINSITSVPITYKSLFLSGANEYYRPLIVISYVANAAFWGLGPISFHVFNIFIHIVNSLLVYWLAVMLLAEKEKREGFALVAALIFLLNPLNSEAVAWVSARPDLLCTFFFLLALILVVQHREKASPTTLCCVALAFLASLFSKEASVALVGIVPVFLLFRLRKEHLKDAVLLNMAIFATAGIYIWLRTGKNLTMDKGVGSVVKNMAGNASAYHRSFLDVLGAYGFYLKKLFFPFPLNFTILDYDKPTAFFALALAVIGAIYLLRRYDTAFLPLLIVFFGIVPPIMAYVGNIPWTPFGERYLYLPMVGFSLLVSLVLLNLKRVPFIVPVVCALLLAIPTMQRVSLWCDGKAFWNDALEKSPGFAKSYSALGAIALSEQNYDDAERNIKKAISLGFGEPVIWQNLAYVYAAKKDYVNYESAMVKAASRSPNPTGIYQELILKLLGTYNNETKKAGFSKVINYHLLTLAKDPSYLDAYYNVGKLYLALGDIRNAERYLRLYTVKAKNGYFSPFALKMIRKIESGDYG